MTARVATTTIARCAIWTAGAVSVPIYETSSADQVRWIASDAECRAIIAEAEHHVEVIGEVRDELPFYTGRRVGIAELAEILVGQA